MQAGRMQQQHHHPMPACITLCLHVSMQYHGRSQPTDLLLPVSPLHLLLQQPLLLLLPAPAPPHMHP